MERIRGIERIILASSDAQRFVKLELNDETHKVPVGEERKADQLSPWNFPNAKKKSFTECTRRWLQCGILPLDQNRLQI